MQANGQAVVGKTAADAGGRLPGFMIEAGETDTEDRVVRVVESKFSVNYNALKQIHKLVRLAHNWNNGTMEYWKIGFWIMK